MNISKQEYLALQDAQEKLSMLEAGGVDNWEFYGEALDGYVPSSELCQQAQDILDELTDGAQIDYPAGRDAGHQIIFSENAVERIVTLLKEKQ